jgi:hypothetical protein
MATKTRGRGRPPTPEGKRHSLRTRSVTLMMTPKLYASLQRSAEAEGVSVTDEITNRIDAGRYSDNAQLLKDLARAMRIAGNWKLKPSPPREGEDGKSMDSYSPAENLRAAARIIVDANLAGQVPDDLLTAHLDYAGPMARWLAYIVLNKLETG